MDKRIQKMIFLIFLIILVALFVLPTYWMVFGSFSVEVKGSGSLSPGLWPKGMDWQNYIDIFNQFPIARWMFNSFVVAFSVAVVSVSTACLAGYAFAKKDFIGKNIIFWLIMLTLMIPIYCIIIPLFMSVKGLGLFNTYPGIFLPISCNAANVFLARQYMSTLPSELIDAAKIDGASELRCFSSVILPLSKPLIAVLVIFSFVYGWKSFMWPLIITSSKEMRTLPVAIATCVTYPDGYNEYGLAMAGATLVTLPIYVVFILFQKYFVKGITMGGIKG